MAPICLSGSYIRSKVLKYSQKNFIHLKRSLHVRVCPHLPSGPSESLLMPANNIYQNGIMGGNGILAPGLGLVPGGTGSLTPSMQLSVNTVDAVTEAIKSDRTIRMWKVEAMKVCLKHF